MPDILDANGLQTATRDELITKYTLGMQAIYGADINLAPDSPDGQQMGLIVQMALDNRDLIRRVYNSVDPDEAQGTVLDKRVAYNAIERNGGTYSEVPVTITTDRSVILDGLDNVGEEQAYSVEDEEGNVWYLKETLTGSGTLLGTLRASETGSISAQPNTINSPVTIVLGVLTVTNSTVPTVIGELLESDADLKIRRRKSVAQTSSGYLASMYAELEKIQGITDLLILENKNSFVLDGMLPHSMWVIIEGTYDDQEVAEAINRKRNGGSNMNGTVTYNVTLVNGNLFEIRWSNAGTEDLYIKLQLASKDVSVAPLIDDIKNQLPSYLDLSMGESVNVNQVISYVNEIDPNSIVVSSSLSLDDVTYTYSVEPAAKLNKLISAPSRIDITTVGP